jgi:tRNA (adenine37-N6)-methyltransferase
LEYSFKTIGLVHTCFKEKFGIPRQPGLVPEAEGVLEILPPFDREEAFRGLEEFSHIWICFIFHATVRDGWKATVRPPRLGGNKRKGVFTTRSNFRPNAIGWSAVKLKEVNYDDGIKLILQGVDFLDGTPVLDIKPYIPYSDSIPEADASYASEPPSNDNEVTFCGEAIKACVDYKLSTNINLKELIDQILRQSPTPAYMNHEENNRIFGMRLFDLDIKWSVEQGSVIVKEIAPYQE